MKVEKVTQRINHDDEQSSTMNPKFPLESNQRNVYFIDEFCRKTILRLPNAPVEFSLSSAIVSTTTLGDKCGLPYTTGFYGRNPCQKRTRLNFEEAAG
ncbi:hypothetical protein CDAR_101961 [Caerostris darwini]|uniref:Uncharacterized protein n=1 Tax=Caerostris darwini TaxID=1538125 RepID=A0AAV4WGX2_9ARAC|nr:hypothetical protein CDAR_101961 [Caerostris darwini]